MYDFNAVSLNHSGMTRLQTIADHITPVAEDILLAPLAVQAVLVVPHGCVYLIL